MSEPSWRETPLFFAAASETLFGVLTSPPVPSTVGTIVLSGGGTPTSVNRNRLSVRLCRHLAALGIEALRFDYHGVGESTGGVERFKLDEPFVEDLTGAVAAMRERGVERIALVGSCFGARTALALAHKVPEACGLILAAPPLRDFEMSEEGVTRIAERETVGHAVRRGLSLRVARGMLDPERRSLYMQYARTKWRALGARRSEGALAWVSPNFLEPLAAAASRRIPTLFVYGADDDYFAEFTEARAGAVGRILDQAGSLIQLCVVPGQMHGFTRLEEQATFIDLVGKWLGEQMAEAANGNEEREEWTSR